MSLRDYGQEFTRALYLAGENYREIVEIVATAPDRDHAMARVMDRLQVDEQPARAVLNLRLEQLTVAARTATGDRHRAATVE